MAEPAVALFRIYDLPWSTGREQEHSFRKIMRMALGVAFAFAVDHGRS